MYVHVVAVDVCFSRGPLTVFDLKGKERVTGKDQSMVSLNRRDTTQSLLLWSHQQLKAAATEAQWLATEKFLVQIPL